MSNAERVGLSRVGLAGLDRVIKEKYIDSGLLPGALVQIWRRGELAHVGMSGVIEVTGNRPMREDAIFRIYSMTKPIIGVALLMLVEEGRIGLSDAVSTYIPSWKDLQVITGGEPGAWVTAAPARPMQVIDLVIHTSGIVGHSDSPLGHVYRDRKIGDWSTDGGLETFIGQLSELPLEFSPGERWVYSGESTDVLGYLIQKVSDARLGEFLHTRLFKPLGMNDTGFFCPAEKSDRFVSCYKPHVGGGFEIHAADALCHEPPKLESGGSGLVSTAADYMRFCRMLLNGGSLDGVRCLSPKSVAMFSTNYLPGNRDFPDMGGPTYSGWGCEGVGYSICCGVTIDVAKRRIPATLGEYFWFGSAATSFWIDPTEDLAVVFMTQMMDFGQFAGLLKVLRTLVYSAFTESFA